MKYPKINKKELSKEGRFFFNLFLKTTKKSLTFDNKENDLSLSKAGIDILSWNIATNLVTSKYYSDFYPTKNE